MTSEADEVGARLPKGVKDPSQTSRRWPNSHRPIAIHLDLRVRKSLPPPLSITHSRLNNLSLQAVLLSSQLSPSCCPVSPNGCVSFPSPLSGSPGTGAGSRGASAVAPPHHAPTMQLGLWHGSDHNRLWWWPRRPKLLSVAQRVPRALQSAHSSPLDAAFCINSVSLASFLPYFMHLNGHSSQDLQNSYPFELEENGKCEILLSPLGKARKTWTQELGVRGSGCRDTEVS